MARRWPEHQLDDGQSISWTLAQAREIGGIRIVSDSDFGNCKQLPCSCPKGGNTTQMPSHLLKAADVEILDESGN